MVGTRENNCIEIRGARQHNLKGIDLSIPRNQLVVITGVSGSGKSTLAFDTIFAEAQRQYVESVGSFARRYLERTSRPEVDSIDGLSPAILIDQSPLGRNPRSTVGTATDIYTLLRLLFSRAGVPRLSAGEFSFNTPAGACNTCRGLGVELTIDEDALLDWGRSLKQGAIRHRGWSVGGRYWNITAATGFFDMEKPLREFNREEIDKLLHSPAIVYQNREPGFVQRFTFEGIASRLLKRQRDERGLEGRADDQQYLKEAACSACGGSRLNQRARAVRVKDRSIHEYCIVPLTEVANLLTSIDTPVAAPIVVSMQSGLSSLIELGVGYLSLNRSIDTLSGGEAQRIKLARQLGNSLTELIYVLDEPTAGLHARDVEHLARILKGIASKPNSLIVVEHDDSIMRAADYIIELGPGAGSKGGRVTAQGSPDAVRMQGGSVTGAYLSQGLMVQRSVTRRTPRSWISLQHLRENNLKDIEVAIPLGVLTCVTGVSGSGKSSLVEAFHKRHPEAVIVDQSAVGNSPRSIPATYVGVFDLIRKEFARACGDDLSLFSFNGAGACPTCEGLGHLKIDMHFLGDIQLECEECRGRRYSDVALSKSWRGKTIADVLDMTVTEALLFFEGSSEITRRLRLLEQVGLEYLALGQPTDTLSGGESQRVKLCSRLGKRGNFYILDEPTKGLHAYDIQRLLDVLDRLVAADNSVLIVEHNLDVIKNADWVIDLGPEAGELGGQVIASGPPEAIAASPNSWTGRYLQRKLADEKKPVITPSGSLS